MGSQFALDWSMWGGSREKRTVGTQEVNVGAFPLGRNHVRLAAHFNQLFPQLGLESSVYFP